MFELNKIYNEDCLSFMKRVPDKYFDLVLTDPPYLIGESGQTNKSRGCLTKSKDYGNKSWDSKELDPQIFEHIFRISKNVIIFGGNHLIHYFPYKSPCWIVWDKDNGETDFADCELAYTNFKSAVRKYKFKWQGMLQQDMANKETRYHQTQKPVELFKLILRDYAKEGFKIYDPFLGSGTTALACEGLTHLKLEWVGTELEPDYVAIANKRLEQVQGSLF